MGFDLVVFIKAAGLVGVFAIIFAETGLFLGFFLPGDSLLFTAGFLASQGFVSIWLLMPVCFLAALSGDNFGYWLGRHFGPKVFRREDSFFFHKDHLERAKSFFAVHGPKSVIFGRFIPIVRTFSATLAGVGHMRYPVFFTFSVIGAVLWAIGITGLGYVLGAKVPRANDYLLLIVAGIIVLSFIPAIVHVARDGEMRERIKNGIRRKFRKEVY